MTQNDHAGFNFKNTALKQQLLTGFNEKWLCNHHDFEMLWQSKSSYKNEFEFTFTSTSIRKTGLLKHGWKS